MGHLLSSLPMKWVDRLENKIFFLIKFNRKNFVANTSVFIKIDLFVNMSEINAVN